MKKNSSFQLHTDKASVILTEMSLPVVKKITDAVAHRANSIARSMSSEPPSFENKTQVGVIKRGRRAIGTVTSQADDNRQEYIAHMALLKSKDAGRI